MKARTCPVLTTKASEACSKPPRDSTSMGEFWIRLLLRLLGGICVLAAIPLLMTRNWFERAHELIGLGSFPTSPVAEYLARSVSALCTFYGGLLITLSRDVRRFSPIIKYQAAAIMALSVMGIYSGVRSGLPARWVIADAIGCWAFLLPMLLLVVRLQASNDRA